MCKSKNKSFAQFTKKCLTFKALLDKRESDNIEDLIFDMALGALEVEAITRATMTEKYEKYRIKANAD